MEALKGRLVPAMWIFLLVYFRFDTFLGMYMSAGYGRANLSSGEFRGVCSTED